MLPVRDEEIGSNIDIIFVARYCTQLATELPWHGSVPNQPPPLWGKKLIGALLFKLEGHI